MSTFVPGVTTVQPVRLMRSHERAGELRVLECGDLRGRSDVFADRAAAGEVLAAMLRDVALPEPLVLAIPAGGVPVAVALASRLAWPLDVAVTSKITLPWNSEAGYGAVSFDGSVLLNDALVSQCGLSAHDIERGIAATRNKVQRRSERLRVGRPSLVLRGRTCVLVDDGLASGFTMRAAIAACKRTGAGQVVVAVPTAHAAAVERMASDPDVQLLVCANIRSGTPFAVADAYLSWQDVPEALAELALERAARP